MRGFEIVSTKNQDDLNLPKRSTEAAAGYDFEASEDVVIPSALSNPFFKGLNILSLGKLKNIRDNEDLQGILKPVLVPTGIKAYMAEGEYLQLVSRSSGPIKKRIMMP
ncbi:MAG: hypothetical protein Q611_LSC00083G0001, partial [Leuconostoc sp. DORA_2]